MSASAGFFPIIASIFFTIVICMGQGRHLYREACLVTQKTLIANKTAEFRGIEPGTAMRIHAGLGSGEALTAPPSGKTIFSRTCAACHAEVTPTAAPALVEIYKLYKDNPAGIVTWAKAPGKKRPQYGQMPPFAQRGEKASEPIK